MKQCKLQIVTLMLITAVFMVPSLVLATVYYPDYNEADQGVTGSGQSVKAYVDSIGSNNATLNFRHNSGGATTTYTFSTDETIPSNINVVIEKGAVLSIGNTITLTINGAFDAGLYQVISGNGNVDFGLGHVKEVYPQWWGAYTDGTNASATTAAIQAAIDTGFMVKLAAGEYLINDSLKIDGSQRGIIGTSHTNTWIKTSANSYPAIEIASTSTVYGGMLKDFMLEGTSSNSGGASGTLISASTKPVSGSTTWDPQLTLSRPQASNGNDFSIAAYTDNVSNSTHKVGLTITSSGSYNGSGSVTVSYVALIAGDVVKE
jgi:hypothetical protein